MDRRCQYWPVLLPWGDLQPAQFQCWIQCRPCGSTVPALDRIRLFAESTTSSILIVKICPSVGSSCVSFWVMGSQWVIYLQFWMLASRYFYQLSLRHSRLRRLTHKARSTVLNFLAISACQTPRGLSFISKITPHYFMQYGSLSCSVCPGVLHTFGPNS